MIKSKLRIIIISFIAFLLVSTITMFLVLKKEREERIRLERNFNETKKEWIDEKGRLVNEVSVLETTTSEMKEIFRKDSSQIVNNYQKRIYSIKEELESANIKINQLEGMTSGGIEVVDTIYVNAEIDKDTVRANYSSPYLNANLLYYINEQYFQMDYTYSDTVNVMHIVRAKTRDDGKPRLLFPNCRWLWGEERKTMVYMSNPKASIEAQVNIEVKKDRKWLRRLRK